jgi:hypothetical protein
VAPGDRRGGAGWRRGTAGAGPGGAGGPPMRGRVAPRWARMPGQPAGRAGGGAKDSAAARTLARYACHVASSSPS